jgi:hypothetical protein
MEFSRRNPLLTVNLADPGIVATDMIDMGRWWDPLADAVFKPLCRKPAEGVKPALRALDAVTGIRYYVGKGSRPVPDRYQRWELDKAVWEATEKIMG